MKNFWKDLPTPFSTLAPMEDVTDIVFRQMIKEVSSPDVFFTEFVNCEGLMSEGRKALIHRLKNSPSQRYTVAQIWGLVPENFKNTSMLIEEMGFDGVDINMGCPQRNITKTGACSALIKTPTLAKEMIEATKSGLKNIPVSVKTRIGFNKIGTEEWIGFLLKQNLAALTIHLRTTREQSKVPAHWEEMPKIIELRNKISPDTVIIGNGDIRNYDDIVDKSKKYNMDGGMIGRGVFTDLNAFSKTPKKDLEQTDRINLCIKHIKLFENTWKETKRYELLKKYYKIYITNFDGAKELRTKLMEIKGFEEALNILFSSNN